MVVAKMAKNVFTLILRSKDSFKPHTQPLFLSNNQSFKNLETELKPRAAVQSAISVSEEKYCSVRGMLKNAVKIASSYEILKE
jgi:uncharacterized OsmC-like protein